MDTATTSMSWRNRNGIMVTGPLGYHSNIEYFEILGVAAGVAPLTDLLVAYVREMFKDRRRKNGI